MTERVGSALIKAIRAMADTLEAELGEQESVRAPEPRASNDPGEAPAEGSKKRRGARPVYRPQGPVDELSAKRAEEALKRRGLLPGPRR